MADEEKKQEPPTAEGAHHALNCAWSIWEHREGTNLSWEDSMYKLCDFETVEEFWAYWNNIPKPRCVIATRRLQYAPLTHICSRILVRYFSTDKRARSL
jgi:hypothetical protein